MPQSRGEKKKRHSAATVEEQAKKLFDCNDMRPFIAAIEQVLPYEGISRSHFFACKVNKLMFLTKLAFYHKSQSELYGKGNNKRTQHSIDAEINILRALKESITDRGVSPCILELVYWKVCNDVVRAAASNLRHYGTTCDKLMHNAQSQPEQLLTSLCEHRDLVKSGLAHNKCAFLVLDRCDITFGRFISKGLNTPIALAVFKSLLFQIVYTIYSINLLFPQFRHTDLHIENVMLKFDLKYTFSANRPRFMRFVSPRGVFHVPYFGIVAKIIDFGHSTLPERGIVSEALSDRFHAFNRSDNDLLLLFHWISMTLTRYAADKSGRADEILSALDPERLYDKYNTTYIRQNDKLVPSYDEMMDSTTWREYKHDVSDQFIYATYGHQRG